MENQRQREKQEIQVGMIKLQQRVDEIRAKIERRKEKKNKGEGEKSIFLMIF